MTTTARGSQRVLSSWYTQPIPSVLQTSLGCSKLICGLKMTETQYEETKIMLILKYGSIFNAAVVFLNSGGEKFSIEEYKVLIDHITTIDQEKI